VEAGAPGLQALLPVKRWASVLQGVAAKEVIHSFLEVSEP